MDSKTKHRILGILVVAGLIVILLPFLQSGKDLSAETTTVKAPPFPDQSIQVTTSSIPITTTGKPADEINQQPDDTIKMDHQNSLLQNREALEKTSSPSHESPDNADKPRHVGEKQTLGHGENSSLRSQEAFGHGDPTTEKSSSQNHESLDTADKPRDDGKKQVLGSHENSSSRGREVLGRNDPEIKSGLPRPAQSAGLVMTTTKKVITASKNVSKKIKNNYIHAPIDDNGLYKLQKAAWVIQVGSFKNKASALRVVNNLRANGYRAFIQQISTTVGESTQVFIGPENKQTAARELAQALENDMHIHGIVISYKPLAL